MGIWRLKLRLKQRHISRGYRRYLDPSLDSHACIEVLGPWEDMKEQTFPLPISVVVIDFVNANCSTFGSDSLVDEVYFLLI